MPTGGRGGFAGAAVSTRLLELNGLRSNLRSWVRLRRRHSSSESASYQVIIADTRSAWSRLQTYDVMREGIATRLTISVSRQVRTLRRRVLQARAPDDLVRLVLGTADQQLLEVPLLLLPSELLHIRTVVVGGIGGLRAADRGGSASAHPPRRGRPCRSARRAR